MMVMKTYLKARYRLSDLLRAQRNDRMTSNLKRWIENGSPDKGDLEEDSYRILRQYFMQKEGRLYLNKDGIVACKRREEDRVLYKYNAIVLPQLYQTELLFRSHDQMSHQGIDKVYQRILKRFEWPGMKKACEKWVTACLSCQQVKDPRKLRFPLQSIESSEINEVVQIDHQKICMTDSGYKSGVGHDRSFYVEFLWKQRPGIGGVAALPPAASQIPGKYLCFLVTRATEKQHVDPENLVLSLTRLRDFLVEMDVKELSLPVYDPNRGRLHPRELYALVLVMFSDTNIQVYLHKKYYLSIG